MRCRVLRRCSHSEPDGRARRFDQLQLPVALAKPVRQWAMPTEFRCSRVFASRFSDALKSFSPGRQRAYAFCAKVAGRTAACRIADGLALVAFAVGVVAVAWALLHYSGEWFFPVAALIAPRVTRHAEREVEEAPEGARRRRRPTEIGGRRAGRAKVNFWMGSPNRPHEFSHSRGFSFSACGEECIC